MKAPFYAAEDYHQDYAINHPNQPYIVFNDAAEGREPEEDVSGCLARSAGDCGGSGQDELMR